MEAKKEKLSLSLEKLNLAPKKKKLLVLNLNGLLLHRSIHTSRLTDHGYYPNPILKSRTADKIHLNFLHPNGELCEYLKGVAEAEDVQSYVKDNAFGLPPLTSTHPHWSYYTQIFTSQFLNFWSAGK
ncbi:hypothetical protein MTR_7g103540 [Medicago truncatula]|uniref:Uncharacterized protein n=1 Tax=Medicago truncatula TaxID=3880 RepID=A0A072U330_MEDTR|nr:hypothetical protein MTR_7g103540 [Medicago truncatula]